MMDTFEVGGLKVLSLLKNSKNFQFVTHFIFKMGIVFSLLPMMSQTIFMRLGLLLRARQD